MAEPQAVGATVRRKWLPNAADQPEKQAFTAEIMLKNVAMARRMRGYAQMVQQHKALCPVCAVVFIPLVRPAYVAYSGSLQG